jgi:hypothetical protein
MFRWLTIYLFALASALNPALAALTVNQLSGFNAFSASSPAASASVVFNDCYDDTTNATTYTFSSVAVSTADATRIILVGVAAEDGGDTFGLSSGTIGGGAATRSHTSTIGLTNHSNFLILGLASGTTTTIELTFSEAITAATICVWSLYNFSSAAFSEYAAYAWNTNSASMDISILGSQTGDLYAAICTAAGTGTTLTFTGTTTNHDANNTEFTVRAGYSFPLASSGTHTATCDPTGTADSSALGVIVRP